MTPDLKLKVEKILPYVKQPSRYIDRELGAIHKPFEKNFVRVALAYPDVYEVGMSHLGLQILYTILNDMEKVVAERVFTPWLDMEEKMREESIPLFSLESYAPLSSFDILGFSLQTELTFTNVLNMLELSGIPLYSRERDDSAPLVIGGGPCAYNPEPLADFFDLFVIGEAEDAVVDLIKAYRKIKTRKKKAKIKREVILKELAKIPGVYVPSLYRVSYKSSGEVLSIEPISENVPPKVLKRLVNNLDGAKFPTSPIVPYANIIHNRCTLEIMRGCTRGCRFCQAGIIYRPVRMRHPKNLFTQAEEILFSSGFDEISLTSLSTTDYEGIEFLTKELADAYSLWGISLSLSSLRIGTFSVELAEQIERVRKTGLTFAPEAGSERLRKVINKNVSDKEIFETVEAAFKAGWRRLKFYFMIGLPTEKEEDVKAIRDLVLKIKEVALSLTPYKERKRVKIVVSVSPFVPKAHTPFQWVAQNSLEEFEEKIDYLKKELKRERNIEFKWHNPKQSFVEGLLSRGDRRVGKVIFEAWRQGAKFDAWQESFDFSLWQEVLQASSLSFDFYNRRIRSLDEIFPWEHIDTGVSKDYLKKEYKKALEGKTTKDCRIGGCTDCGVCPIFGIKIGKAIKKVS